MRFFLDSVDADEARRVKDWGLLDGVVVRYGPALDVAGLPIDEALRVVEEAMLANSGLRRFTPP